MECKKCGHENPDGAAYCIRCGRKVNKKGRGPGIPVAVVLIIAVLVAGVCVISGAGNSEDPVMQQTPTTATEAPAETEPTETEAMETEPAETDPTETEPPETEAQTPEERLPNVPEEWLEHILLQHRDAGSCEVLRDEVVVTVFFVEDPESVWTEEELARNQADLEEAAEVMEQEAARYGVFLELRLVYHEALSQTTDTDYYRWGEDILTGAGMPGIMEINQELERAYGVEAAPVVFFLNRPGRAYASGNDAPMGREYLVLFQEAAAFRHELCHLFGAVDYYYPDIVEEQAQALFPDSLMAESELTKVDPLTAYLIGWTDELSDDAMTFLEATASLTREAFSEEYKGETYTGYIEVEEDYGTYVGGMVEGEHQGYGKLVWNDGDVYEGQWVGNLQNGYGTLTWNDGDVYEGEWVDGKRHGQGTMTWSDGTVYVGQWVDGKRHGLGTMTGSDGTVYVGQWVDNEPHGQGMMIWADGSRYYGEWRDGKLHGQGTVILPFGIVWSGRWEEGVFLDWFW